MAVTYVASSALLALNVNPPSGTLTLPALNADDVIAIMVLSKNITVPSNEIDTPSGYTLKGSLANVDSAVAADDFRYGVYYKRAVGGDSGAGVTISRAGTSTVLLAAVAHVFRGAVASGDPWIGQAQQGNTTVADAITYPAFSPGAACHAVYLGFYGNDLTTASTIAGTDPSLVVRSDLETSASSDCTLICNSDDSSGAAVASRTQATTSTADSSSAGWVGGLTAAGGGGGGGLVGPLIGGRLTRSRLAGTNGRLVA